MPGYPHPSEVGLPGLLAVVLCLPGRVLCPRDAPPHDDHVGAPLKNCRPGGGVPLVLNRNRGKNNFFYLIIKGMMKRMLK